MDRANRAERSRLSGARHAGVKPDAVQRMRDRDAEFSIRRGFMQQRDRSRLRFRAQLLAGVAGYQDGRDLFIEFGSQLFDHVEPGRRARPTPIPSPDPPQS